MAPTTKYLCPCFRCISRKQLSKRTIRIHSRENLEHLNNLIASGAHQETVDFVQQCHIEITQLLGSLTEGSQSSRQLGSSHPGGKCLIFFNALNNLLICLDLADAPIASPSFLEAELRDDDDMMVNDDRK